jgi:hypothetical protein
MPGSRIVLEHIYRTHGAAKILRDISFTTCCRTDVQENVELTMVAARLASGPAGELTGEE